MTEPPAATARIAAASSSTLPIRSFSRYARPAEPCSSSATAYPGATYWLRTTTPMPGMVLACPRSRLDPLVGAGRRHPDVGHDDVGLLALDQLQQRRQVARGAGQLHVVVGGHQAGDALTEQHVVLGQHDSNSRHRGRSYRSPRDFRAARGTRRPPLAGGFLTRKVVPPSLPGASTQETMAAWEPSAISSRASWRRSLADGRGRGADRRTARCGRDGRARRGTADRLRLWPLPAGGQGQRRDG